MTTAQALSQFLEDITATDYQTSSFIPARKQSVDERLQASFPDTSDLPYFKGVLMGSAAKNTIIRPFDDIDVLAVFSNEKQAWRRYGSDSRSFIYRIRDAYSGTLVQQVGTRGQAIRVFYKTGGHVDVAPVFYRGDDVYWLPDGAGGWTPTAPLKANAWFSTRNSELGRHLAPVVRLLKAWNRSHSKRMRSFHLESVAGSMFTSLGSNYREALQRYFEWAPNWLRVSDPGGQSGDLSSYLTSSNRHNLLQSLSSAADISRRANEFEHRGNHAEAKRLWRIVLGEGLVTT